MTACFAYGVITLGVEAFGSNLLKDILRGDGRLVLWDRISFLTEFVSTRSCLACYDSILGLTAIHTWHGVAWKLALLFAG